MNSRSARALALVLLLTLGAPAPRMAAWLLGPAPAADFASRRHEPQARGRNRVPSPVGATAVAALAGLTSGGPGPLARTRSPRRDRAVSSPARPALRPAGFPFAPIPGPTRLRC